MVMFEDTSNKNIYLDLNFNLLARGYRKYIFPSIIWQLTMKKLSLYISKSLNFKLSFQKQNTKYVH